MSSSFVVLVAQAAGRGNPDSGLTLREVMASLPVDPASLFGLALLLGFFVMVFWYGTRTGKPPAAPTAPPSPETQPMGAPAPTGSSTASDSPGDRPPVSPPGGKRPGKP